MQATILDDKTQLFPETNDAVEPLLTIAAGETVELGAKRSSTGKTWTKAKLVSGEQGFLLGEINTFRIRKVNLLQSQVKVFESPSRESELKSTLPRSTQFFILQTTEVDGKPWARIRHTESEEGFIDGLTPVEDVVTHRFRTERVAFIAVAAMVAGIVISTFSNPDIPSVGIMAIVAFLMTGVYVMGKTFMGIGGFSEPFVFDEVVPKQDFDWMRFVLEPVYFLGVGTACLLFVGACIVFREYIWPIMKG